MLELLARCIPEGKGSVIGRKRGVFGPLFGKPAEKTRPFEQTQEAVPRNFPPVPTSRSATETEPFRPGPLPPVFGFWPPPGPARDPPKTSGYYLDIRENKIFPGVGSTGEIICIFLTVCVLPPRKGDLPCIYLALHTCAERIYA